MKKHGRKKVRKALSNGASKTKKLAKKLNGNARKLLGKKAKSIVSNAKKRMNNIKKQSSKTIRVAKHKLHTTEEEIAHYVKQNPVKSITTVALVGLIAGFLSRHRN